MLNASMNENELSYKIIGVAIDLHTHLGPGLLESVYEATLAYDLRELGLEVKTQVPMPLIYKEVKQDIGYRIDLLVENKVIIEVKSVENIAAVHFAQTLTYLKLADKKLALLINFNTKLLKDSIHRIVNQL
ncbi:GxxExxY protein [Hydrotalea sp.]|uniref:GxxExxY protein n=1 Tax=Hydrotalea sp. TaxID=2881279 RepID=UPI00262AC72A|nr:GxxExxY protein [Hydrotalea sp.]